MAWNLLLGILYGSLWGIIGNLLLFRKMANNRTAGYDSLRGIGIVFFVRYLVDALALVMFYLMLRSGEALVAAGLSITVAAQVSLFAVYARKGGKFE
ncbi:MAG: hypothetical protein AB2385_01025 [Symbiobacterium sp.]|uniref:hypothetical protein n=1 Tax=Symbiobacterium sp. TaxID=1971213 RepID=UPI0034641B43